MKTGAGAGERAGVDRELRAGYLVRNKKQAAEAVSRSRPLVMTRPQTPDDLESVPAFPTKAERT